MNAKCVKLSTRLEVVNVGFVVVVDAPDQIETPVEDELAPTDLFPRHDQAGKGQCEPANEGDKRASGVGEELQPLGRAILPLAPGLEHPERQEPDGSVKHLQVPDQQQIHQQPQLAPGGTDHTLGWSEAWVAGGWVKTGWAERTLGPQPESAAQRRASYTLSQG